MDHVFVVDVVLSISTIKAIACYRNMWNFLFMSCDDFANHLGPLHFLTISQCAKVTATASFNCS